MITPALVVDVHLAPAALRDRLRGAPCRRERQRIGQVGRLDAGARLRVADRLDLADQGRVHEAVGLLRRPQPGVNRAAQKVGRGDDGARVGVEGAELGVGLEARQRPVEPLDELLRPLGRRSRGPLAGPGSADDQAHLAPHRLEGDVALVHDELLTTGAAGAGAGAGAVAAAALAAELPLEAEPEETVVFPLGTLPPSAITRVSTMRRIRTGRGGLAATALGELPSAGSFP